MALITICMTTPPYRGIITQDALDFAMGATNYGHEVNLVFLDDGVFQLVAGHQPVDGVKSHEKRLKSLPFFDIEALYCCESSLKTRHISSDDIPHDIEMCDAASISELMQNSDHVVRF